MQLKSYHAPSMREGMRLVREELGDEAVIVSSIEGDDGEVKITAALEKAEPVPAEDAVRRQPGNRDERAPIDALSNTLSYHGVPAALSGSLVEYARRADIADPSSALTSALGEMFQFAPLPTRGPARPVMLVGPAGAGKTTTTAKLAARLVIQGMSATVINADVSRAAAAEQLAAITTILGADLRSATTPEELAEIFAHRAAGKAVFVDSFAINPYDNAAMKRLNEFVVSIEADPVLVLGAEMDAAEAADTAEAFAGIGARRMITTRLDQARRLGSILCAAHAAGLAIADAGVTPHVANGLSALDAVTLSRLLCRNPETPPCPTAPEEVSE
jgi:flagellar biosynthesis protein FlhF